MTASSIHRLLRSRSYTALVWAMVPVVLFNGRWVFGCISPAGRYTAGCDCCARMHGSAQAGKAHQCACCKAHNPTRQTTHSGTAGRSGCACGHAAAVTSNHEIQSHQVATHRRATHDTATKEKLVRADKCTGVAAFLVIPTVAVKVGVAEQDMSISPIAPALLFDSLSACGAHPATTRIEWDTGAPPDNLVLTLRRLVI